MGIYLVQSPHELDLHNTYDFCDLHYSVKERSLLLRWRRSERDGIPSSLPSLITLEYRGVTEFRFRPRDPALPFTEDDCLRDYGYWTDEDWADGVMVCDQSQDCDEQFLTALEFMSGAMIAVQADSACATIAA